MSRAARRYAEAREEADPGSTPAIDDPQLYECPLCPLPKGHDGECLIQEGRTVKPRVYRSGAYYRWYCPNCEHTTAGVRAHIVAVNEAREHAGKCGGTSC